MPSLEPLMRRNFLEYASYVVVDRAIPDLRDGCKPVQRRIFHTLFEMDDGKFNKVANIIGECMKLHPHGDASIGDALVVLANKGIALGHDSLGYFIERQGNFGNLLTGDGAAAARYIECRLTPLAKETLFNPALTTFMPSYDGRRQEPEALPAKIPVVLLLGTEGIAVGMATTILPHNFGELLLAQVKILQAEQKGEGFPKLRVLPDFPQGGLMDASDYADGRGKVKVRAKLVANGEREVVIKEIPFGTTTEKLMESIEDAVQKGKVKISNIEDRTTDQVEIILHLSRGVQPADVIAQLYAYTDCEVSVNSNLTVIRDSRPHETTVSELLRYLTAQLKDQIKAELEHELKGLVDRQHYLTLEQIFIENRVYKRIETERTEDGVKQAVVSGMAPFASRFVRPMNDDDIKRLLDIPVRRISLYDIEKSRREVDAIMQSIAEIHAKLRDLVGTTIDWIEALHGKYAKLFPRRTKVREMEDIDKKAVAIANLKVVYDSESGFIGTAVKSGDRELKCSEYDKIIAIFQNGVYRIMSPVEKTLLEGKLIYLEKFDAEKGLKLTVVYRDKDKAAWAKKVHIQSFIKDREYELIKERAGKIDYFNTKPDGVVTATLVPIPKQRTSEETLDLATVEECGLAARGTRISERPVAKIAVHRPGKE